MIAQAQDRAAAAPEQDQFAVSEHAFLERLSSEDSGISRTRLEDTGGGRAAGSLYPRPSMMARLYSYAGRQPGTALGAAFVLGLVLGVVLKR
jgi:hypothetical protein